MPKEITKGSVCTVRKSYGPFSSGTLVRVRETRKNGTCVVKLMSNVDEAYLKNLKAHGINESGIFEIDQDYLTRRRGQDL